jgi:hypothetical protein
MHMNEVSLIFMQMDPILWKDSLSNITSRDFFHVDIIGEVFLLAIDIYGEVRMMVHDERSRNEEIRESEGDSCDHESEKKVFHRKKLINRLNHDFETPQCEPYGDDETRFIDMERSQGNHENPSYREKDSLSDTRIHRMKTHIATIVYFFGKKEKNREET